jgi:hypothetical protein
MNRVSSNALGKGMQERIIRALDAHGGS